MSHDRTNIDDVSLDTLAQQCAREAVRRLPEDELSLSWRSDLNERLRLTAGRNVRRRRWMNWALKPALGLGVVGAATFAIVATTVRTPVTSRAPQIEGVLFEEHQRGSNLALVSAVGPASLDSANAPSTTVTATPDWNETDTETL